MYDVQAVLIYLERLARLRLVLEGSELFLNKILDVADKILKDLDDMLPTLCQQGHSSCIFACVPLNIRVPGRDT